MSKRMLEAVPVALVALFLSLYSTPSFADARIVRLSSVEGNVQIDRNTGQGFERAFLNLPVTQGVKLRIRGEGRAEIEFEDGSTLRIASDTQVEFPELSLLESGGKNSRVNVATGTAYVNFEGAKDDQLTLTFGHEKLAFTHPTHLRLELAQIDAAVAVFKGDVQLETPSGPVALGKNQTANLDFRKDDKCEVAKNIEANPFDEWDKSQEKYHQRYTVASNSNYSPFAYGSSDMAYYGNFFNAPGYGMMWQPYLAGAGWDPFMDGAWAFSPGMGYGWVSAYPWGWTPYHTGSWTFLPGHGWAWQPGGAWSAFASVPRIVNPPHNFVMPQAPGSGRSTIVVNRGPVSTLAGHSGNKMVVRNNSAGLGVPRGSVDHLTKVSETVQRGGEVTTKFHPAPVATPTSARAPGATPSGNWGHGQAQPGTRSNSPAPRSMPSSAPAPSRGAGGAPRPGK
jgi:hypothetical protein